MAETPPNEIIDFQSDALEIKNQKLPLAVRLCVWMPLLLVVLAITWACLAQMDVVVQGQGKLVTNVSTIVMKPLERSVIQKVNVQIGDVVKKDQVLITFDPAFNTAEAERLKNDLKLLEAQVARLRAEFQQTDYVPTKDQFAQWQSAIFKQRRNYYQERMNYFAEALSQIAASQKSKQDSLRKQRERLAAMVKLEKMFSSLRESKAVSLKELIEVSISRMEMEATVDQLENDILELDHRRGTTTAEKNSFIQEWRNSIVEDMVSADRNLTATRKDYDKVAQLIEYVYLRAPCDAVVHEITAFSPGSAVQEAEALITLIPLVDDIEMEAEIRPQDIGKIHPGSTARIKLNAYPFQKHGTLDGVVRNISENTLQKNGQGASFTYYRARLTVSGKLRALQGEFRMIPGMEGSCEIKCGRRRVIEYVIYPLIKAFDEAAREP
ncbi:MAG: HlyD family type I secretion periplasmic adaptor subunit [Lentisphaeria bacterium]|nr:HlyD family type I secretion periplasmic adaptor subunit [Lentisphaeria bacterium]